MGSPNLAGSRRTLARPAVTAPAGVAVLTTVGLLAATLDPALAGSTAPHPALSGTLGEFLAILQNNARVLAAPFLLSILGFPHSRTGRIAGDTHIWLLVGASAIPVGLELARWQARLLPYIPQLPLEWAALTLALYTWLYARTATGRPRELTQLAALTLLLLTAAASIETWAVPHR